MEKHKNRIEVINNQEDVDSKSSERRGLSGLVETFLRKFRTISYLLALAPLYLLAVIAMGTALTPGIYIVYLTQQAVVGYYIILQIFLLSCAIVFAYFIYGFFIIFIVPLINFLLPFKQKPFRGGYFSIESVPWYIHNALTYIVRYTFLEFVTPTPFNPLFYRMMGMKIGHGSHINTTNISDPALIELGDKVTIGGSVHIIAHYASKGYIIVAPVKIGNGVTIGLKATIMGDVEIGDGAVIAPHEVILPKSRIPAGRKPDIKRIILDEDK